MISAERAWVKDLRHGIKAGVFALSFAVVSPLALTAWLEKRLKAGETLFLLWGQMLAILPGFPGRCLRGAFYFCTLDRCSWETHIGFGSLFTHRGAEIGSRVSLGSYCIVGHALVGPDVMIGSRVSIPSGKRQHFDDEGRLADVTHFERVAIGSNTWIGEGAILMADVGHGCVVSAGAVVSKGMPNGYLIAGNPARAIRPVECSAQAMQAD